MTACAQHRDYLVAVADGEAGLVPSDALEHIQSCRRCQRELGVHRALGDRLKLALDAPPQRAVATMTRPRRGLLPVAAGAAVALVAATALVVNMTRPDPVAAAAIVAAKPPQFSSGDPQQVSAWCQRESGRPMKQVALAGLTTVGARMDHVAGAGIITVAYRLPDGQRAEVSWLDSSTAPAAGRSVSTRQVEGKAVLVVTSDDGTAVVSGPAPYPELWQLAGRVETS